MAIIERLQCHMPATVSYINAVTNFVTKIPCFNAYASRGTGENLRRGSCCVINLKHELEMCP